MFVYLSVSLLFDYLNIKSTSYVLGVIHVVKVGNEPVNFILYVANETNDISLMPYY